MESQKEVQLMGIKKSQYTFQNDPYKVSKHYRGANFTPELRQKIHKMLKFEVFDIKAVNQYINEMLQRVEFIEQKPHNQMFWDDYEMAIYQKYGNASNENLEFQIGINELQTYVHCLHHLNRPGLCTFGTRDLTNISTMIKVLIMRITEIKNDSDLKCYIRMLTTVTCMGKIQHIVDNNLITHIYDTFIQYHERMSLADFKRMSVALFHHKISIKHKLFNHYEEAFKAKFSAEISKMTLEDIVPISRVAKKQPLKSFLPIMIQMNSFLLNIESKYLNQTKSHNWSLTDLQQLILFLEGSLYCDKFDKSTQTALRVSKVCSVLYSFKQDFTLNIFERLGKTIMSADILIESQEMTDLIKYLIEKYKGKIMGDLQVNLLGIMALLSINDKEILAIAEDVVPNFPLSKDLKQKKLEKANQSVVTEIQEENSKEQVALIDIKAAQNANTTSDIQQQPSLSGQITENLVVQSSESDKAIYLEASLQPYEVYERWLEQNPDNQIQTNVSSMVTSSYVKVLLSQQEVGKSLSDNKRDVVLTLLDNSQIQGIHQIAEALISKELYWNQEPQIWEKISYSLTSNIRLDFKSIQLFKECFSLLMQSNYTSIPALTLEIILKKYQKFCSVGELDQMIEMRNQFMKYQPQNLGQLMSLESNILIIIKRFANSNIPVLTRNDKFVKLTVRPRQHNSNLYMRGASYVPQKVKSFLRP